VFVIFSTSAFGAKWAVRDFLSLAFFGCSLTLSYMAVLYVLSANVIGFTIKLRLPQTHKKLNICMLFVTLCGADACNILSHTMRHDDDMTTKMMMLSNFGS
jgi:hypothetical protein